MLDFAPKGGAFPQNARAFWAGGGARVRLFDRPTGYLLHVGSERGHQGRLFSALWLDLGAQAIFTGGLTRPGFEVGLGVDLAVVDGLQVAPFARFMHIRQDDPSLDGNDPSMVLVGVSFSTGFPNGIIHRVEPEKREVAPVAQVVDADNDGIEDPRDECPLQPGEAARGGCPNLDSDGDGIADAEDHCPLLGWLAPNGCPETDSDDDGYPDSKDKCPGQAEIYNGMQDDDGCPDRGEALVVLARDRIELKQSLKLDPVRFGSAEWAVNKDSYLMLATLARVLTLHPEIRKLRVEGHTDAVGTREFNIHLSQKRAEAVMQHLIEVCKLDPKRLQSEGFGFDRPLADNETFAGRARNRRVELKITDRVPITETTTIVQPPRRIERAPEGAATPR